MALNDKQLPKGNGGGDRVEQPNIDPGTYPARVVQIIDLGLQAQRPYMGQEKKPANEIMITYELTDLFMIDEEGKDVEDKPRWISETLPWFGLYADKAKSTQRYNAFDPKGEYEGDFAKCIGTPVNVVIVNNESKGKTYDNVASVSAMRAKDAEKTPELVNKSKVLDLANPDVDVFNSLPKWIQDKIKDNLEFKGSKLAAALNGEAPAKETPKKEVKSFSERIKEEEQHGTVGSNHDAAGDRSAGDSNDVPW